MTGLPHSQPKGEPVRHTATPWTSKLYDSQVVIYGPDKIQVLATSWHGSIRASYPLKAESLANAAFVLEAVNSHDRLTAEIASLTARCEAMAKALQAVVDDVNAYERMNNLAPNPGRTECWDSVAEAKRILGLARTPTERGE